MNVCGYVRAYIHTTGRTAPGTFAAVSGTCAAESVAAASVPAAEPSSPVSVCVCVCVCVCV